MMSIQKPSPVHDGKLTIAVGRSRREKDWKNKEMTWGQFLDRLRQTTYTGETVDEYKKLPKADRDNIKDVGGFVGGALKGGRRLLRTVTWRQLLTLDADFAGPGLWDKVAILLDCACCAYSTHSHTPETPRLRLVIPLSRPVSPDEYPAIARRIAADIGIDLFDDTTYEPHRLMYWPSTPKDGEYVFELQDGPWLDADAVLARYPDWQDVSYWPESSRTRETRKKAAEKQGDPCAKNGLIGAFCRTYTVTEAIETFLSDVYAPCDTPGRYTYLPGSSTAGLVVYDEDRFAYSHHGTDPASGKLCNAFDLVRIHKFGERDEDAGHNTPTVKLPSYKAMLEFVGADPRVTETVHQDRLDAIEEDFAGKEVSPERLFFDGKRFIPAFMGEWFLKRHRAVLINDELYVYQDGVYVRGERIFQEEATAALGKEFATRRLTEALNYVKNTVQSISPEEATASSKYLNVLNGLLNLDTFELEPHTPDLLTIVQLPVSFDPDADTSVIDEFLRQVMPEDCIPVFEEFAGYCLVPSMRHEKALLLIGEGGNGKGTLIAALASLLGKENVSGVSLQDLAENRFAAADLFGKMANLHADIPNKVLENTSRFKELVSGDLIRAEEKHKSPFTFRNRAKLVFSANEPPTSKDNTEGFHRKMLAIRFPNKFTDRALRARLFDPESLSGFLLRALQGLRRLREQDEFTQSESIKEVLKAYRQHGDTVFRFVNECCVIDAEAMTPKQDLYNAYRNMCYQWGNQPVNQANFNSHLQALHPHLKEYRKEPPRRWQGIRLELETFT